MEDNSSLNSNRTISAIAALVIAWVCWPIISPTLVVLNFLAMIPIQLIGFLVFSVGESLLFCVSLICFLLVVKESLGKGESNSNQDNGQNHKETKIPSSSSDKEESKTDGNQETLYNKATESIKDFEDDQPNREF